MSLRIRRGTDTQRSGVIFEVGEIVWSTDTKQLWIGDGITQGGSNISAGLYGYGLTVNNTTKKLEVSGLNTDDVEEGVNNKYFDSTLAEQAIADALSAGNEFNSNIEFAYDDLNHRITANVTLDGIGLISIADDATPTLGGNLDINNYNITGTGDIDITGDVIVDGNISTNSITATSDTIYSIASIPVNGFDRSSHPIYVGDNSNPTTLWFKSNTTNFAIMQGLTDGTATAGLSFKTSRGTMSSPVAVEPADPVTFLEGAAHNGSEFVTIGAVGLSTDANWDGNPGTNGEIPGSFGALILDKTGGQHLLTFDSTGTLSVSNRIIVPDGTASNPSIGFTTDGSQDTGFFHPGDGILCISTDATERVRVDNGGMRVNGFMKVKNVNGTLPNPPEEGMIVLDGTTFKGYTSSGWVNLN